MDTCCTTTRNPGHSLSAVRTGIAGRALIPAWSFVYGFFSSGVPYDAPNRSEPCSRLLD